MNANKVTLNDIEKAQSRSVLEVKNAHLCCDEFGGARLAINLDIGARVIIMVAFEKCRPLALPAKITKMEVCAKKSCQIEQRAKSLSDLLCRTNLEALSEIIDFFFSAAAAALFRF